MIDRYQLRYFLAVVDAGNFSRAAAQVNVTQPTLSVGIAKLERELGSQLFFRNSRRVHLTEAGNRFLENARRIENDFDRLEQSARQVETRRLVRLGVLASLPTALVQSIVEAHENATERDRLEIVDGSERDLLARLDRGRLDVALTLLHDGPARRRQEFLFEEGYALAVSAHHPRAQAPIVDGESLAHDVMIVRRHCEVLSATSRYFTDRGVRPAFSYRSGNDDRVLAMVRAGLGITVMPESFQDPGIRRPKLAGFDHRRRIGLVFAERADLLQLASSSVLSAIRSVAGSRP